MSSVTTTAAEHDARVGLLRGVVAALVLMAALVVLVDLGITLLSRA